MDRINLSNIHRSCFSNDDKCVTTIVLSFVLHNVTIFIINQFANEKSRIVQTTYTSKQNAVDVCVILSTF